MADHVITPTAANQALPPLTLTGVEQEVAIRQTGSPFYSVELRATAAITVGHVTGGDTYPVLANEPFVVVPDRAEVTLFVTGAAAATLSFFSIGVAR
jgi:hypothetical protein